MLVIIQVGHVEASDRYIRNKVKAIKNAGLNVEVYNLSENCETSDVVNTIKKANEINNCSSIMVQLPLPYHIDGNVVLRSIPKDKDIDCLNPENKKPPLTPSAIMRWLDNNDIRIEGKNVVIIGRSELVGKPLSLLMVDAGATVSIINSKTSVFTKNNLCKNADIVVSAAGHYGVVDTECVGSNEQIFIDVGINKNEIGKLCGDVNDDARKKIFENGGFCTPVPGGVGKWTVNELVNRLTDMEKSKFGV